MIFSMTIIISILSKQNVNILYYYIVLLYDFKWWTMFHVSKLFNFYV